MVPVREPSQITFALRGTYMVSKMLTYVYIGSMGPFKNVYINKCCRDYIFERLKDHIISRGVFKTFELRVLTVIDCPKIAGAKGW